MQLDVPGLTSINSPSSSMHARWLQGYFHNLKFVTIIYILQHQFSMFSLFCRIGISIVALVIIYLRLGPPSYEEVDLINSIMYLGLVPFILIGGTIALCFLVGLPITLSRSINNWWYARPYIALIGLTIGILCCYISNLSQFKESESILLNGENIIRQIPNNRFLIFGWFVTAFSLIHFYPESLSNSIKIKSWFNS